MNYIQSTEKELIIFEEIGIYYNSDKKKEKKKE